MKKLLILAAMTGMLSACDRGGSQGGTGSDTTSGSGSGSSSQRTYERTDTNSQTAVPQDNTGLQDLNRSGNTNGSTGSGADTSGTSQTTPK